MGGLKVAAVQMGFYREPTEKAIDEAERQVRLASARGAELVCLPEHWLFYTVIEEDDGIIRRFASLAKDEGVHINLGGSFERRGAKVYMTSQTVSPEGTVSRQDKIHLYRREKERAVPGSGFRLVDVRGFKVGVLVCHDIVFPEAAREVTLKGAELLLVPSFITAKGIEPWLVYLRARALENRVPVVAPNIYAPPRLPGKSAVIDLSYDRKAHVMELAERMAPGRRTLVLADIDVSSKGPLRSERLRELRLTTSHSE
ncbi:MAG: carbon-nitrogen hydrolase family protein [Thaumarchaeota archaeon]|nr:carbon-nitrogen hydrolase family protein [Nitrososphaerota archaeon]